MKPTTLEEALSMVPTHWPLTPKQEKLQIGDEITKGSERITLTPENGIDHIGYVNWREELAMRPIPQDVRESAAWWLRLTVELEHKCIPMYRVLSIFDEAKADTEWCEDSLSYCFPVISYGGIAKVIKELSAGPDPLGRWILAGKP